MKWNYSLAIIIAVCIGQVTYGQNSSKKAGKSITITGKIINQQQKPVEGAVFYIDNLKTSFKSKSNGSYKVKASSSAVKLKVISPEYGAGETLINGQKTINFTLDGITENPSFNSAISGENGQNQNPAPSSSKTRAKKMNTYSNIYQMIRGEVRGVVVSGKSVQVMQGHSFYGSRTPLFVVNGIIVTSIDFVNPVEVKSITYLKGSQAAIYGINGTNGVISITLLNGSEREK
jgi:hypothetical protein